VELPIEEIEKYINEISLGEKLIYVSTSFGEEVPLLLKSISHKDKRIAELIRNNSQKEAEKMGLPRMEEMEKQLSIRGSFTAEDEKELERLRSQLKGQKAVLAKTTRVPANRDRIKNIIKTINDKIGTILLKKEKLLGLTCERKAIEQKQLYLTWCAVYNPYTDNRYWKSYEAFQAEEDFLFHRKVVNEYIIHSYGYPTEVVRAVARNNIWRVRYIASVKSIGSLFGCAVSDFTADQLSLVYWSLFYQNVYEMMSDDRPPEEIIEDDESLDAYMEDINAEKSRESSASTAKKYSKGAKNAWDHKEVIVMASNPSYKDANYSETLASKLKHKGKTTLDAAPTNTKGLNKVLL
jgi:hypothetical protein